MAEWLTPKQAGERVQRHWRTITDACRSGELHGEQRAVNTSWRIEAACLDAWMRGTLCIHRHSNVTPIRRSA
ncbi:helix-turn-helix domain-containing protein [Curtobacterium sp. MCBD17_008]|uniref:helix-turn-helix domain-containing protein n=1 Tax=Curtobacterium sp. MCBD17_008 TaxID=2175656 RepID=UPI000DAA877E|nr:helix-turn-helix domain-containing protein [Curtobacterium sp. MCBD17_008]PZE89973.1 hypothetical protein DEI95_13210 [Curtobacterium sp. MCBD17_008]